MSTGIFISWIHFIFIMKVHAFHQLTTPFLCKLHSAVGSHLSHSLSSDVTAGAPEFRVRELDCWNFKKISWRTFVVIGNISQREVGNANKLQTLIIFVLMKSKALTTAKNRRLAIANLMIFVGHFFLLYTARTIACPVLYTCYVWIMLGDSELTEKTFRMSVLLLWLDFFIERFFWLNWIYHSWNNNRIEEWCN